MIDFSQFNFIQFTEEENSELTIINASIALHYDRLATYNSKIIELDKAGEEEQAREARLELVRTWNTYNQAKAAQSRIYRAAEERYYKSVTTEQAILDDARKVLAVADKAAFEEQQGNARKAKEFTTGAIRFIEEYGEGEPATAEARAAWDKLKDIEVTFTYNDYRAFLIMATRLQLKALEYHELNKNALIDIISEQAAAAYPPEEQPGEMLTEQQVAEIITQAPLDNGELAVDKINTDFINMLKDATEGQLAFAEFDTVKANPQEPEALVTVSVDFTGLDENIARNISYYDKRVMTAVNTLWENGETLTTLSRIYSAMGNKGRPAASDIEKIKNSLIKQMSIVLKLGNRAEHEKYNYEAFEYYGNLLNVKILYHEKIQKNGKIIEGAVQVLDKPALVDFAKKRKQVSPITLKMLQTPINKTERNLAIEDYVQIRVCRDEHQAKETAIQRHKEYVRAKDKKAFKDISIDKKMLYATIFNKTEITGRTQQFRAKETIQKILDYYLAENIKNISALKYEADAVIITYTFTPEQIAQAMELKKQSNEKAKQKGSEKL